MAENDVLLDFNIGGSAPVEGGDPQVQEPQGEEPQGQEQTAAPEGEQQAAPTSQADPPAGKETPPTDPEKELLRQQLATMQAQMQAQAAAPQAPQQAQDTLPPYAFNIPPELLQLMYSEDPTERQQGLTAYAMGIARTVHSQVRDEYQQVMQSAIQQAIASTQQAQQVRQDFYGKYPELDKPELYPVVQAVAQQVAAQTGANSWTPEFRDAVGERVRALIQPQAQPQPPRTPASGQATAGNGRPAVGQKPTMADEIAALL